MIQFLCKQVWISCRKQYVCHILSIVEWLQNNGSKNNFTFLFYTGWSHITAQVHSCTSVGFTMWGCLHDKNKWSSTFNAENKLVSPLPGCLIKISILETQDPDCQTGLTQVTTAMNMQIHDWTLDEIDISLTTLPAADSEENRLGKCHTHTYTCTNTHAQGVKHMYRWVIVIQSEMSAWGRWDTDAEVSMTNSLLSITYIFSVNRLLKIPAGDYSISVSCWPCCSPADHRTATKLILLTEWNNLLW